MKTLFLILSILGVAPLSAATIFNIYYDTTGGPFVSGLDGTIPGPPGLPLVSTLTANAPSGMHITTGGIWLLDQSIQ